MKTVGILTMHKVLNYGSALQAWATQEIIKKLGYDAFLIDYTYPNEYHKSFNQKNILQEIKRYCLHLILGFPLEKKRKAFSFFWKNRYRLSVCYQNRDEIRRNPPEYDIYVAGSDQIWNPSQIHEDTTFFLDFVPKGKKKISYASSLAQSRIDGNFKNLVEKNLSDFSAISVRERNGVQSLKNVLSVPIEISLDPTLLLTKEDYQVLAEYSQVKISQPYMLVYILKYAYNPYPYATEFIKKAYEQTGLKIVCLDFSAKQRLGIKDVTYLHDAVGPAEFVWLFANASLVITTSFHGTAFALNFGIPFYSILYDVSTGDDRMKSLIDYCGVGNRGIIKNSSIGQISMDMDLSQIGKSLSIARAKSLTYLKKNLSD